MDAATHRINNRLVDKFNNAGQWDFNSILFSIFSVKSFYILRVLFLSLSLFIFCIFKTIIIIIIIIIIIVIIITIIQ